MISPTPAISSLARDQLTPRPRFNVRPFFEPSLGWLCMPRRTRLLFLERRKLTLGILDAAKAEGDRLETTAFAQARAVSGNQMPKLFGGLVHRLNVRRRQYQ